MLYITHDLLSARLLADDVMVLNLGVMVERGPTLEVIGDAKDPYTRKLLAAIPNPGAIRKPGLDKRSGTAAGPETTPEDTPLVGS